MARGEPGRRAVLGGMAGMAALGWAGRAQAASGDPAHVLLTWYGLVLELVRHTATYSPPVASRAFAYLGIIAWEAQRLHDPARLTLAGQLPELAPGPQAEGDCDPALVLHGALAQGVRALFGNTGPTGQRVLDRVEARQTEALSAGLTPDLVAASLGHGQAVADHVLAWAATDGGARIDNMGFPQTWDGTGDAGAWVPTSRIVQQQAPLLPDWGRNRLFAAQSGCSLPPHPPYSEDPASAFHAEAVEVLEVSRTLTDEQKLIARFWSDDPMLSPTPPGHWISIALGLIARDGLPAPRAAEVLMRLGVAVADAFILCWAEKYRYDLVRPVTYIKAHLDPAWTPLLITPPFPEYPSGHSVQSGAAEVVLAAAFGAATPFEDATHEADGLPVRRFPSFRAAAEEAALSRLYGGIHFRSAIALGLDYGRCIGQGALTLRCTA